MRSLKTIPGIVKVPSISKTTPLIGDKTSWIREEERVEIFGSIASSIRVVRIGFRTKINTDRIKNEQDLKHLLLISD